MADLIPFDEKEAVRQNVSAASESDLIPFDDAEAERQARFGSAANLERFSREEGIQLDPEFERLLGIEPEQAEIVEERPTPAGSSAERSRILPKSPEDLAGEEERRKREKEERLKPNFMLQGRERLGISSAVEAEEEIEDLGHTVKLAGERMIMSTAELADFITAVGDFFTIGEPLTAESFEALSEEQKLALQFTLGIDGEDITNPETLAQKTRETIEAAYGAIGVTPELEPIQGTGDIATSLLASNIGPGLVANVLKSGVKNLAKVGPSLLTGPPRPTPANITDDFLKTELKIGSTGAAVGTTAAALETGDLEEKKAIAEMANIFGIGGHVLLNLSPTLGVAKALARKKKEAEEFLEGGSAYDMAADKVNKFIADLVPPEEVAAVRKRMDLVRSVQRIYPDFKPTVGNIIGTEESRSLQRLTDSVAFDKATNQYFATRRAVDQMIKDMSEITDPSQRATIANALNVYSREASSYITTLQDEIVSLEEKARSVNTFGFKASDSGQAIREQLKTLRKQYAEVRDQMFNDVDPNDTVRFLSSPLNTKIKAMTESGDLDRIIDKDDPGFKFITKSLPQFIKKKANRSESGDPAFLTFREIHEIRKTLGNKARKISRSNPESNMPNVLTDIKNELDRIVDAKMISGDKDVANRFEDANRFYREEFRPRFIEGTGGKLQELTQRNDFAVRTDDIGDKFWRPGNKEQNLEEFNNIFSVENIGNNLGKFADETSVAAVETARNNLRQHALNTLDDAMQKRKGSKPLDVLKEWKQTYRGALNTFEDVADDVARVEQDLIDFEVQKFSRNTQIKEINDRIIAKFAETDPSQLIPDLLKGSPEETARRIDDMRAAAAGAGARDFDLSGRFPGVQLGSAEDEVKFMRALKDNVRHHLMAQSYDSNLGTVKWQKLDNLINNTKKEHLSEIFTKEELSGIEEFKEAVKLMGDETKPVRPVELNRLKQTFDSLGFSPASVLSRYYSAQLGKVGPTYLIADGLTRFFTKASDVHFKKAYEAALYDLEGLENVLRHVGSKEAADTAKSFRTSLATVAGTVTDRSAKAVRAKIKQMMNGNNLLSGFKIEQALEEAEAGVAGDLAYNYLLMNDDLTTQPSRVVVDFMDEPEDDDIEGLGFDGGDTTEDGTPLPAQGTPDVEEPAADISGPQSVQSAATTVQGAARDLQSFATEQEALSREPITQTINLGEEQ